MRLIGLAVIFTFSLTLAPLGGEAQQAAPVPRIGYLGTLSASDPRALRSLEAFRQGLRELGYVDGQNIAIEIRWAQSQYEVLPRLAAELVALKVNVIVVGSSPAVQAAKHATATIPIVMGSVGDPVAAGFVASLARPGGNITGISNMVPDLGGKRLELLMEIVPQVAAVALLWNPANPGNTVQLREAEAASRALGVRLQLLEARNSSERPPITARVRWP
jgi:putative ABC transport system substrate-binding protein